MRASIRFLLLPTVVLLSLVMPGTAHADPSVIAQADWEAQLNAAIDQSTVFQPGTTAEFLTENKDTGDRTYVVVRADGSLHGQRTTAGTTTRIRCVRVDRCWEQSQTGYGDLRWHLLPTGTVTYVNARTYWMTTMIGLPWPAGSVYMTGPDEDGTILYVIGTGTPTTAKLVITGVHPTEIATLNTTLVNGNPVSTSGGEAGTVTDAPAVRPPARTSLGRPATSAEPWTVPINPPAG